jgi:hypothetical protein
MKRALFVMAILISLALSASAESVTECNYVVNSKPWDDRTYSFCYSAGFICVYCWSTERGVGCADYAPCDPLPKPPPQPPILLADGVTLTQGAGNPDLNMLRRLARLNPRELL